MTNRTASLLLLFVVALALTGVLLAVFVTAVGRSLSSPWIAPALAISCATTVLHLGRQYILPRWLVEESRRAATTLATIVSTALVAALGLVWLMEWSIGRVVDMPPAIVPLWFAFLWLLVQRQHAHRRSLV